MIKNNTHLIVLMYKKLIINNLWFSKNLCQL